MAFKDVKEIFNTMAGAFNPSAAKGLDAVFPGEAHSMRGKSSYLRIQVLSR